MFISGDHEGISNTQYNINKLIWQGSPFSGKYNKRLIVYVLSYTTTRAVEVVRSVSQRFRDRYHLRSVETSFHNTDSLNDYSETFIKSTVMRV